jgi:PTS system nitrogen regulatory IIA component
MKLSSYLEEKLIFFDVEGDNLGEIINNLIDNTAEVNKKVAERKQQVKTAIMKRENEISTAMGEGVAIPHARLESFDDFLVVLGFPKKPIKAEIGLTGKYDEVTVVFLLLSDVLKNKNMLKVMSGISKLVIKHPDIMKEIRENKSASKIISLIDKLHVEVGQRIVADDVMTPDIPPVTPDSTLEEIAKRLIMEMRPGFAVVDKNGNFLGEITERELIAFGMPKYTSIMDDLSFMTVGEPFEGYLLNEKTTTIDEIYRKEGLFVVDREAPIMEISFLIVNKGATRIYVVEDGKYYGMILRSDIIKKVLHI